MPQLHAAGLLYIHLLTVTTQRNRDDAQGTYWRADTQQQQHAELR